MWCQQNPETQIQILILSCFVLWYRYYMYYEEVKGYAPIQGFIIKEQVRVDCMIKTYNVWAYTYTLLHKDACGSIRLLSTNTDDRSVEKWPWLWLRKTISGSSDNVCVVFLCEDGKHSQCISTHTMEILWWKFRISLVRNQYYQRQPTSSILLQNETLTITVCLKHRVTLIAVQLSRDRVLTPERYRKIWPIFLCW